MRLNKYLAHCGITSRRKAAELIKQGKVYVNDKKIDHPAFEVKQNDIVKYNSKIIKPEKNRIYILMNKPKNVITSLNDEKNRKTVIDILKNKIKERIYPVGRLDYNTTGLLLLTNDGDLAKKLSHPSYQVPKVYQVTLNKPAKVEDIEKIRKGIVLEDGPVKVNWIKNIDNSNLIFNLEIHVGKNRIVRRIFEHFNYRVDKLDRIYYAGLSKKGLKRGWFRYLTSEEIRMLKHFI